MATSGNIKEKIKQLELDTLSAQSWARADKLEEWVHKFLLSGTGGESNSIFSKGLKRERRWWRGPIKVRLNALSPAVGPEPGMEYLVDKDAWFEWTSNLAAGFTESTALPPLIVEYRAGELSIRDGNTRFGAMSLLGWTTCWAVIWYNSEDDFQQHTRVVYE